MPSQSPSAGTTTRPCHPLAALALLLLAGVPAGAADYGIGAKKLLLKSSGKVVLVSKELVLNGADPVGGTDSWISFKAVGPPVTLNLPGTLWTANGSGTAFKYKNDQAPAGPSVVKIVKAKDGLLKVTAKGLPFPVPVGSATVNVVVGLGGANTYCMTFVGDGDGTTFQVKDAAPGSCCGNGSADGSEPCDGGDSLACPGLCNNCACPVCGNNTTEPGEQCDGSDAAACPGNCGGNCICKLPCEVTQGGLCWYRGAVGSSCNDTCAAAGRYYDDATRTFAGSDGTNSNCAALAAAYGKSGATTGSGFSPLYVSEGLGCYDGGGTGFVRDTARTRSFAFFPAVFGSGARRLCACQDGVADCDASSGGFCWYHRLSEVTCDGVCAAAGKTCATATATYAGSSGSDANCAAVVSAMLGSSVTVDEASASCASTGLGCTAVFDTDEYIHLKRCASPSTTCSAGSEDSARMCACQ